MYDPDHTFEDGEHVLPHTVARNRVMDGAIDAGAAAFVGSLVDHPSETCRYFVPYDGQDRPIPGVWIRGSDGTWLHDQLAQRPVRIRLTVDSTAEPLDGFELCGQLTQA